jgi:transcription antitermination factor NusG
MPILQRETELFPAGLLESDAANTTPWWAMYTMARQEKKLMRNLVELGISFYAPVISRRFRSPNGRTRVTYQPLFSNYVFVCGDELQRYRCVSTGAVSRCLPVAQTGELLHDLKQIKSLIYLDAPLSPERRIEPGQKVRIRSGSFAGYEGIVVRREQEIRLLVSVRFMNQGVSVVLDDCQMEAI